MAERSAVGTQGSAGAAKRGGLLVSAAFSLIVASALAADVSVTASVDQNAVAVGESIVLSIDISGAQNVPAPELGNLVGFRARYLGPSTQVSIVNGQVSASVSHRFALVAERAGRFALGPFRVEHAGRTLESNTVEVEVGAGGRSGPAAAPREQLSLAVRPAKTELWAGERVPLEIKLYVGDVRVDDLQLPQVSGEGVIVDRLGQPARQMEVVGGRRYQTLGFRTAMTALRPGDIDLGATMSMNVIVPRRRGGDRLFDQFFGDAFGDKRSVEVRADPTRLAVRPLPDAGRPADFSGAIGRFDFTLTAAPNEVAIGDPVTVRMRIAGQGDLSRVGAPRIAAGDRFRAYDPLPQKDEENEGTRVFEQVLIPKEAGSIEIPAVRFSYFDTGAGTYRTVTRGPLPLSVRPAAAGERPEVVSGAEPGARPAEAPAPLGRDIVYIKDAPGRLAPRAAPLHSRLSFLVLQFLPPFAFLAIVLLIRQRERLAADPRLVRFRQAGGQARQRLAALSRGDANPAFYDQLAMALTSYLAAKLDLPPGAVDRDRVLGRLSSNGSSEDLRDLVRRFFDLVEGARYAPGAGGQGDRAAALELASGIVERLERVRRVDGRRGAWLALGFALLLAATVAADLPGVTVFFQGNAAYSEGRYAEAARHYEQILAAGRESTALYFNLGNAHFRSGEIGRAILNYERALRRAPRDPDVRVNLSYAEEIAETVPAEPSLWQRAAFPLAFRATAGELAAAWTILWCALWGLLCVRLHATRIRTGLGRAAAVTALLAVLVATSLAFRVAAIERSDSAVVTVSGETAVRFEPSETGTEHFRVREGALLEVTDERDGWAQVRSRDGLRGWMPSEALSRIEER
jgi:tetratricopeptide (TPR) repeat protein